MIIVWVIWFWINHTTEAVGGCEVFRSHIKNINVSINGSDTDDCCQLGDCLCSSLDKALNCSSNKNEITIYISSEEVPLSTTADISNVSNFTLVSNGASIDCNGGGGIVFRNIKNLVISKITWKNCGNSPGAISVYDSLLLIKDSNFQHSITRALAVYHSSMYISSDAKLSLFSNNNGGALYVSNTSLILDGCFKFYNSFATYGAAIYFTDHSSFSLANGTQILFLNNVASMYGGAIYADLRTLCDEQQIVIKSGINSSVTFTGNIAGLAGKSWYFELNTSCNLTRNLSDPNSLLYYPSSFEYTDSEFSNEISTTLYQLKLLPPANCTNFISNNSCNEYEISGIMSGQEILIPAHALGYYGNIARPTQVLINHLTNADDDYILAGNKVALIHNNTLVRGITILSNSSFVTNTTLQLMAFGDENLSINLTVQLSSCYPGFENVNISGYLHCKCYQHKNVQCPSDSTAIIKFGYWFGKVKEQPTITYCPQQYCDFTSCDVTSFGHCILSHFQDDQCRHHRIGPACGRCKPGYTLTFDSPQCVKIDKCSEGIRSTLTLLLVLYWYLVVGSIMTLSAHIIIGHTYGIIYFYSVINFLVGNIDNWHVFRFVTILSNVAKLTPKYLGTWCFTSVFGWSETGQQFFHYVHPIVVFSILLIIFLIKRYFNCFEKICRKLHIPSVNSTGVCLAILLSYTSLASTSLELLLPLTFSNVDGIYTYTSPDQEYFHNSHGFFGTVAIVVIMGIIAFSALLLLEPFLSRKVNLVKVKPMLDTFQECYKPKYRHFAAFYLLCRLAILVVFYGIDNHYDRSFALQLLCVVIAIIHGYFMPYRNNKLNILDFVILIIAVFAASFNTVFSFTSFHSTESADNIVIGIVSSPMVIICIILFVRFIQYIQAKICRNRYLEDERIEDELPPARLSLFRGRRNYANYISVNDSIDSNDDYLIADQNNNDTNENENIMEMSFR